MSHMLNTKWAKMCCLQLGNDNLSKSSDAVPEFLIVHVTKEKIRSQVKRGNFKKKHSTVEGKSEKRQNSEFFASKENRNLFPEKKFHS